MATLKQRVHRFNGTDYDTVHYETSSSCVLLSNGNYLSTYESYITGSSVASHNQDASTITSGTLGVARGGTGASTLTSGSYILGNGTSAVQFKTAAQVLSHIGAAASSHTHTASQISGLSTIPSGVICIWSGAANAIPSGWYLCDGNNGTPNLSGKFVIGYSSTYTVGKTGGEATHTLTQAELPATVTVKSISNKSPNTGSSYYHPAPSSTGSSTQKPYPLGSGTAHNNMPPYYALCYIMKA